MTPSFRHSQRGQRTPGAFVLGAAFLASAPLPASAQEIRAQNAEPSVPAGITLVSALPAGSHLDERHLIAAIGSELGVAVVREPGASGGTLHVRQEGETVTVTFDGPTGRHDERRFVLEARSGSAEQEVALVAVNVARDQTGAFRVSALPMSAASPVPPAPSALQTPQPLAAAQTPPAPQAPPPPAASPPDPRPPSPDASAAAPAESRSACARLRASAHPRESFGLDFAPYAGTSSFDRRPVRYLSIGALGALSGGVSGVAVSGLVNADGGPVCGAEVAGLVNVADGVDGVQIGGIANVASDDSTGVQIGLVDVASHGLSGGQIGLVSVAHQANVQVGLVNVASDADVQIGLFNIDLHGRLAVDAWSKPEAGTLLVGIKHGPAHSHTIYAFEMNAATGTPWAAFGLGAHLTPARRLSVDIDLLQHVELAASSNGPNQLSEVRGLLGYQLLSHVTAFAGPTFNVLDVSDPGRANSPGYASLLGNDRKNHVRGWPGVTLGLEIP